MKWKEWRVLGGEGFRGGLFFFILQNKYPNLGNSKIVSDEGFGGLG
jgi:hypothetical protein